MTEEKRGNAAPLLFARAFMVLTATSSLITLISSIVSRPLTKIAATISVVLLCITALVEFLIFLSKKSRKPADAPAQASSTARPPLNGARETQPPTAAPTPEPRLTRLDKEDEPTLAPALSAPPNSNRLKLPMFANLEKLNSVDFQIWQAVDRSKNQVITIERNTLSAAKALKAFSPGYSPLHNPDPMFNELSDADDVVTIDRQRLQYKPIVIDRALTRLCDAGVLERGEWQGSRRAYSLLIPYDNPAEPSV